MVLKVLCNASQSITKYTYVCVSFYQIEYSRAMVTSSKEKASYLWTEINKTEEEVAKDLTDVDSEARLPANSVTIARCNLCVCQLFGFKLGTTNPVCLKNITVVISSQ